MALLAYFKRANLKKQTKIDSVLPKPDSLLSQVMPMSSIEAANTAVRHVMMKAPKVKESEELDCDEEIVRRGKYQHFTDKERLELGKRASEHGITSTIRYFVAKPGEERNLSPSTLFAWKEKYLRELKRQRYDEHPAVTEFPSAKRGRPLLLGSELDARVEHFLKALRANGAVINTAVVMATADGIIRNHDSSLLAENSGPIAITRHWASSIMTRMNYVKRRGNSKAKVTVTDFDELKKQFISDIQVISEFEEIPDELILNWDHTGVNYIPVSSWTMEKEGTKKVDITGMNDKRQITVVLSVTKTGHYLPPQLIYAGKTSKCLPKIDFPSGWCVTCTDNHWANEYTTLQYLDEILLPYIKQKRKELGCPDDQACLVIFDRFKAQCTATVLGVLEKNNILVSLVPANCTDRLQPLDVSVNKSVKEFLRRQFHEWYPGEVSQQLQSGEEVKLVDLRLSRVKPLAATWLIRLMDYLIMHPEIAVNGFRQAGLL